MIASVNTNKAVVSCRQVREREEKLPFSLTVKLKISLQEKGNYKAEAQHGQTYGLTVHVPLD